MRACLQPALLNLAAKNGDARFILRVPAAADDDKPHMLTHSSFAAKLLKGLQLQGMVLLWAKLAN